MTRKVDILTPLGALYYNTGRYEEALQVYREAAALQPDSTDIWLALVSRYTHAHTHSIMECQDIWVCVCCHILDVKQNNICLCQTLKNLFLLFHTNITHTLYFCPRLRF